MTFDAREHEGYRRAWTAGSSQPKPIRESNARLAVPSTLVVSTSPISVPQLLATLTPRNSSGSAFVRWCRERSSQISEGRAEGF